MRDCFGWDIQVTTIALLLRRIRSALLPQSICRLTHSNMRLINTQTFELELFTDPVPAEVPYAILSHTWTDDEVTFEDMQDVAIARCKPAFSKIEKTCQMAADYGLWYAWVDTCCIDKSSSAELSEAINSMFRWYKNALLCYAFLSDLFPANDAQSSYDFRECRWFKRGWTLQELIAPTNLLIFDEAWNLVGAKSDFEEEIARITGISRWVLNGSMPLSSIPLAKRMSWAAGRQTTRVEDMTYCLLGIFDVNMPMIYGEGSRAFVRLQEDILKRSTDLSLFAWEATSSTEYRGILADSPAEFIRCGEIVLSEDQFRFRDEISMTNKGVKINTALEYSDTGIFILDLHCYREKASGVSTRVGIYLKRALDTYFRHAPQQTTVARVQPGNLPRSLFLASATDVDMISTMLHDDKSRRICFEFPKDTHLFRVGDIKAVPETYWHGNEQHFSIHGLPSFLCFVRFRVTSRVSPRELHYGTAREESSSFVLVCNVAGVPNLRMSLYAETGLQSSPKLEGFIDPFKDIAQYGPLGDPFSLSVLSPGDREDHRVTMIHGDHRHDYVVSATLRTTTTQSPPFHILIRVSPPDDYQIDRRQASTAGHDAKPYG